MALWQWLLIGIGSVLFVSFTVALMLAAILGSISHDFARVFEAEPWTAPRPLRSRQPVTR
jgi:hypothetical protein